MLEPERYEAGNDPRRPSRDRAGASTQMRTKKHMRIESPTHFYQAASEEAARAFIDAIEWVNDSDITTAVDPADSTRVLVIDGALEEGDQINPPWEIARSVPA